MLVYFRAVNLNDWKSKGSFFEYESHKVFYVFEKSKEKPVLLLLHGFPTASWDWKFVWDELQDHFSLLSLDLMGFGFSDKPTDFNYSLLKQAELCEALLASLKIKQYHILAHDYGDTVAQELLARYYDSKIDILSCCLLNGGLFPGSYRPRFIQQLLLNGFTGPFVSKYVSKWSLRRTFNRIFGENTKPSEELIDEWWQLFEHNDGRSVLHSVIQYMKERSTQQERWTKALTECVVPLRLINGADDPISGAHMAERFKELVPNPDVAMIRNIGHYPQVESPDQVLMFFLAFHGSGQDS